MREGYFGWHPKRLSSIQLHLNWCIFHLINYPKKEVDTVPKFHFFSYIILQDEETTRLKKFHLLTVNNKLCTCFHTFFYVATGKEKICGRSQRYCQSNVPMPWGLNVLDLFSNFDYVEWSVCLIGTVKWKVSSGPFLVTRTAMRDALKQSRYRGIRSLSIIKVLVYLDNHRSRTIMFIIEGRWQGAQITPAL